ncbi:hypothetical protein IAG25_15670 [Caballeronia sp. EK]|uniref:hypothetical protein n=1 Tax=Caballeronia sp. EK TaxID=2767469 RepID=UPI0016552420|nr:hypothetical protein [Caballeronia sp. EK]MBC8638260.1 hypothetical protein [Caballeronia sp. EK]
MTQVTSYQVPAHPSGLDMRTQLNAIVLALVGDNAGPTAPLPTYPGMMWGDTTANRLKRRTNANDAWIDLGPIDNFLSEVKASVANCVLRTGDTMTGSLTLAATGVISQPLMMKAGSYSPHIRSNNSMYGFEWVNGANNAVPMWLTDAGTLQVAQGFTTGAQGEVRYQHSKGTIRVRGDGGIGYNGGFGFVNSAGTAWRFQMSDEGYWSLPNYGQGPLNISNSVAAPDTNGYQGTLGAGFIKLNEYNYGAYLDFARARSQDFVWRQHYNFNNGYLEFICNGGGSMYMTSDGNFYASAVGWLSNINGAIAGKANAGARAQWDSGVNEWGPINGPTTLDMGAPWVMEGWRTNSNGNWVSGAQWIRGVVLRNQ